MKRAPLTRSTLHQRYYRPTHPLRPRNYWVYRRQPNATITLAKYGLMVLGAIYLLQQLLFV